MAKFFAEKKTLIDFNFEFENSFEILDIVANDPICIVGYPENQKGKLFKCETKVKGFLKDNVIQYDGEVSKGQNGAPIYLFKNKRCQLIGVHTGFDEKTMTNIGTLISEDIY